MFVLFLGKNEARSRIFLWGGPFMKSLISLIMAIFLTACGVPVETPKPVGRPLTVKGVEADYLACLNRVYATPEGQRLATDFILNPERDGAASAKIDNANQANEDQKRDILLFYENSNQCRDRFIENLIDINSNYSAFVTYNYYYLDILIGEILDNEIDIGAFNNKVVDLYNNSKLKLKSLNKRRRLTEKEKESQDFMNLLTIGKYNQNDYRERILHQE